MKTSNPAQKAVENPQNLRKHLKNLLRQEIEKQSS